jgi:hypothetical protein
MFEQGLLKHYQDFLKLLHKQMNAWTQGPGKRVGRVKQPELRVRDHGVSREARRFSVPHHV